MHVVAVEEGAEANVVKSFALLAEPPAPHESWDPNLEDLTSAEEA